MAIYMGAVMAVIMLGYMWSMYQSKPLNIGIIAVSVLGTPRLQVGDNAALLTLGSSSVTCHRPLDYKSVESERVLSSGSTACATRQSQSTHHNEAGETGTSLSNKHYPDRVPGYGVGSNRSSRPD